MRMLIPADVVAQRRYVRSAKQIHPSGSLGIGPAILRGLRDLGYPDTAAAICALVDNAIDARANEIDVVVEVEAGQVAALAVIDNGIGMVPEMLRAACAVGASCSIGDGPHLARSGFGLPSAPFAMGTRFALYSRPSNGALMGVEVDLGRITGDEDGIGPAEPAKLPRFVTAHLARSNRQWTSGTIVVVSDLDRIAPRSPKLLKAELRQRLGYVFQHFSRRVNLKVNAEAISAIDPLFLTPGVVGYDADEERAQAFGCLEISLGDVAMTLRSSLLPPSFAALDKTGHHSARNANERFPIVRDMGGLVVSRLGRRIAMLATTPLANFTASDRGIRLELDFPPELDELFAPSLSLGQVQISNKVWAALREQGFARHIELLRRELAQQRRQRTLDASAGAIEEPRPSGGVIAASNKE